MEGSPLTDATANVDDMTESIAGAVEEMPDRIDKHTHDAINDLIGRVDSLASTLGERLGENNIRHAELVAMLDRVLEAVEKAGDEGSKAIDDAVADTQKVIDEIEETPVIVKKRSGMLMKRGRK